MKIPSLVRAEERKQFFRKHSPELNQMTENVDAAGLSDGVVGCSACTLDASRL
jgi:hypothetical protein